MSGLIKHPLVSTLILILSSCAKNKSWQPCYKVASLNKHGGQRIDFGIIDVSYD